MAQPQGAHAVPFLIEIILFLVAVVIITPLFKRLGASPVLGYLLLGSLIGPHAIGIISDAKEVQHFAELGVVFLMFTIGLELSLERLRAFAPVIFGVGSLQVGLSALVIGGIAWWWGNDGASAVLIGLCLSLSSTAMVMQLLDERRERGTPHGTAAFSVLLFQDLAVIPILILVPMLAGENNQSFWVVLPLALGKAALVMGGIALAGRYLLPPLFRMATWTRSNDVYTAMMLLVILLISLGTGMLGLSMALGAFLAGLVLSDTAYRHRIESEIAPVKGLLLGLFFIGVGLNLDFAQAFSFGIWVVLSVFGLLVLKAVIAIGVLWWFQRDRKVAIRSGLLLAESGEFAFIVLAQAMPHEGLISPDIGQFMIVVATLSMMLTPLLARLGQQLGERLGGAAAGGSESDEPAEPAAPDQEGLRDHIIISGYGSTGQAVAAILQDHGFQWIGLDARDDVVKKARASGQFVMLGDASRIDLLQRAGLDRARLLVITMDDHELVARTARMIRHHAPELPIVVRTRSAEEARALADAGVTLVLPEKIEAGLQLGAMALRAGGRPEDSVVAYIRGLRYEHHQRLETHSPARVAD